MTRTENDLKIAGITPFTSLDYPGKLSCVVFVQGCPWKCLYCHNPHMQSRAFDPGIMHASWEILASHLESRKGLLDAVVFSGGEPTIDPALPATVKAVRAMGFAVGLHTSGCYPERLREVLPDLDWVGLDVKAPLDDDAHYAYVAGTPASYASSTKVREALEAVMQSGVAYECRTTAHPAYLDAERILRLARDLCERGVTHYALQVYRKPKELDLPFENVGYEFPGRELEESLKALFKHFTLRRP